MLLCVQSLKYGSTIATHISHFLTYLYEHRTNRVYHLILRKILSLVTLRSTIRLCRHTNRYDYVHNIYVHLLNERTIYTNTIVFNTHSYTHTLCSFRRKYGNFAARKFTSIYTGEWVCDYMYISRCTTRQPKNNAKMWVARFFCRTSLNYRTKTKQGFASHTKAIRCDLSRRRLNTDVVSSNCAIVSPPRPIQPGSHKHQLT